MTSMDDIEDALVLAAAARWADMLDRAAEADRQGTGTGEEEEGLLDAIAELYAAIRDRNGMARRRRATVARLAGDSSE